MAMTRVVTTKATTPTEQPDTDLTDTADTRKEGAPIDILAIRDGRHQVAAFESYLDDALERYEHDLAAAKDPQQELLLSNAIMHVSTINIGAHAFDSVKAFFDRREKYPTVQLIVAEDNEAVIKTVAKGRSAKLRHVARTHRINLDWLYDFFAIQKCRHDTFPPTINWQTLARR